MDRSARHLLYHYVSEGPPTRRQTVSRAELRAQLTELLVTHRPASLLDVLGPTPPGADAFTVSFDDAHVSVLEHAVPVLRELGLTATLFVPTAFVGTSDELLDVQGLREVQAAGWTLGSHSATHPRMGWRLYDEDDAAYRARLLRELISSRQTLAGWLGAAPTLFAYPYGEAPEAARDLAQQAGYEAAFTVVGAQEDLLWDGDPLRVPRLDPCVPAPCSETPTGFTVVVPACDRAPIVADVVRRLVSQSYPDDRYEVILVDDGSSPPLAAWFSDGPPHFRLIRQGDETFRAGQARQRGVSAARFDHIVFLDADVAVDPDFLWHLDWVHRREPDVVLLGYLSGYNLHDLGFLHTPTQVLGHDVAELPIIPDRCREPTLRAHLDNLDWIAEPWPLTYTGNLSLPRALLERSGGFADGFEGWGLEDVDLGVRLHRAGGRFVFSRFAVGTHIVDPAEPASRNPFRRTRPEASDFDGYRANLARLEARHPDDAAVQSYVARAREDIAETVRRPTTVGLEMGGHAAHRSPHHRRLHRVQPGGVPREELLDRVAYAEKVGAGSLYLLGGAPAEHEAFVDVLSAARFEWISMQTLAYPFAEPALLAAAMGSGLRGVVLLLHTLRAVPYEALHGEGTWAAFDAGLRALEASTLERGLHLVVHDVTWRSVLEEAVQRGWVLDEVTLLDGVDTIAEVEAATGRTPRVA
ncbi:MAG: polysaccharide deacetylase family protein [Sandaracinaceae bacterium]